MNFKKYVLAFACVFAFFSSGCSYNRPDVSDRIDLSTGWEYSLADPFFCEKNGIPVAYGTLSDGQLGNLEKLVPGEYGSIWLRKTFILPKSFEGKDVAAYLGRITLADRTYLNRTLIGHEGFFPPKPFTAWNTARFYEIPEAILNMEGPNEILVEIFVNGEGSIVSNPFIGDYKAAKFSAANEQFWNSKINIILAFLMLVLAIYHFIIWSMKKDERENFWFGLINLITAAYMSVFYLTEVPGLPSGTVPFIWYQKIFSSSMLFVLPFLIQSFVNAFFGRHDRLWIRIARAVFVAVPVVVSLFARNYVQLRHLRAFINPMILPPILYIIGSIIYSVIKRRKDSVPLLLGFSPLIVTSLLDIVLHDLFHLYFLPYFSSMGWQLVIVALLFVLARRFAKSRLEAEYLNVHLQDEVEDRTKELTLANSRLTEANDKLERARILAEKDMRLAVYVQQSFYPRGVPEIDGWDMAYTFRPMSGVSGDLYDFFYEGRRLDGIALFDVSGHGIASGLVAMLSKTVISKNFTSDQNVNICSIMKDINDGIVKEKGDIENYLTGLLLRTYGNRVQYVSAGHPTVFLRTAKNGKAFPVALKGSDGAEVSPGSGAIVGIPGMDLDVQGISFSMNPGDALIMYTDCLSESKNVDGAEFGQDGVSRAFAESGGRSAREKLDDVLLEFERFTEGEKIRDDLTVIILQKK